MQMSTTSNMCTLSCALIVCILVSAARTTDTNTDDPNKTTREPFNSKETTMTTTEDMNDWEVSPSTAPTANGKYGPKPTLSTPPVTDLNDSQLYPDVTANAIDISTTPRNDYIPSDKKKSYTSEPIPTTNGTQLLPQPPTRTQPLTTTPIANGRYNSTTTPGTPSGTNLNDTMQGDEANVNLSEDVLDNSQTPENNKYSSTEPIQTNDHTQTTLKEPLTRMTSTARTTTADDPNVTKFDSTEDDTFEDWTSRVQLPNSTFTTIQKDGSTTTPGTLSVTDLTVKPQQDVMGNSTSQPKPKDGYNLSQKKYSSTKSIPANDDTRSKPKKSKTKWSNDFIPSIWLTTERPTRYYRTTEWIIPTKNCKCAFGKQHSRRCKKNEKETTTTNVWERLSEYEQWDQRRHMSETTTNNVQGQLEKSKKWEIQQKVLEMESNRLNTILDVFNSR